mgnify:FL=1
MKIYLSDKFTYGKLLRFTAPSIIMMIFTSIYGVVDGFFVSNYVGKTPFAAVNFIYPFLMILGTVGFMFGTGGSAIVAKTLGENNEEKANRLFSFFVYISVALGAVIAVLAFIFIRPIAAALHAEGELLENCVLYGRIFILGLPMYVLQMEFQSFFVTAGKPGLGFLSTVAGGLTNMIFDALFIVVFKWGLAGAAAATVMGQCVGGIIPLAYFFRPNTSLLRLGKTNFDGAALLKATTNGSSELMSNISMSLVSMLYNVQLIKYAGEDGVSAYGVLMYVNLVFLAIFIGYSIGTAPVIGYHYGAKNPAEIGSILKKSFVIIGISSLAMLGFSEMMAGPLSRIFVGYDPALYEMTVHGFRIFSFQFLFAGVSIFVSSFFTALSNGGVSAMISFLRTLVFQTAAILILPLIWRLDGIWISIVAAELVSFVVSLIYIAAKRKKYGY